MRDTLAGRSGLAPDGKYLFATQFVNQGRGGGVGGGMAIFDLAKKTFTKMRWRMQPSARSPQGICVYCDHAGQKPCDNNSCGPGTGLGIRDGACS
ncbi:MAG TPA: hypothetical protein VH639_22205 [Bryobacteraceae bacterium]